MAEVAVPQRVAEYCYSVAEGLSPSRKICFYLTAGKVSATFQQLVSGHWNGPTDIRPLKITVQENGLGVINKSIEELIPAQIRCALGQLAEGKRTVSFLGVTDLTTEIPHAFLISRLGEPLVF